jgi:hypothetical protein
MVCRVLRETLNLYLRVGWQRWSVRTFSLINLAARCLSFLWKKLLPSFEVPAKAQSKTGVVGGWYEQDLLIHYAPFIFDTLKLKFKLIKKKQEVFSVSKSHLRQTHYNSLVLRHCESFNGRSLTELIVVEESMHEWFENCIDLTTWWLL